MVQRKTAIKKLLFIGSGNIAFSVAAGLVSSGTVSGDNIYIYNRHVSNFEKFQKIGINTTTDIAIAMNDADLIFLAVKPAVVAQVMDDLSVFGDRLDNVTVVSLAASVTIEQIENYADRKLAVIRTMPTTSIEIGEGIIAVTHNERVSNDVFRNFCRMMSTVAHVTVIDEMFMNPIISVQGSSPAYVYLFVKSMLDAAIKQGFDEKVALPLILKTVSGAVSMIAKGDTDIDTLIKNVASPNGTTLAALNSFEKDDFAGTIERAMRACTERANEITASL